MDENKKKLYVGNLSYDTTLDGLKQAFAKFGEIVDAIIIVNKFTGRSKGFGFIEFQDEKSAQDAVAGMNGADLDGRKLVVNIAKPSRPKEESAPVSSEPVMPKEEVKPVEKAEEPKEEASEAKEETAKK